MASLAMEASEMATEKPLEDILDYEAEEPDEDQKPADLTEKIESEKDEMEEKEDVSEPESLEEGEVSDEDEESRKERLKPQPVCRFYSKGQCTWGASCRFVHPGVLDKGNYNMFAPPRPILPTESEPIEKIIEEEQKLKSPEGSKFLFLTIFVNIINRYFNQSHLT